MPLRRSNPFDLVQLIIPNDYGAAGFFRDHASHLHGICLRFDVEGDEALSFHKREVVLEPSHGLPDYFSVWFCRAVGGCNPGDLSQSSM